MFKKTCFLLAICLVLLSLTSCYNNVPKKTEVIYDCIEGQRIPFDDISTGIYSKDLGCIVLQSKKDVEEAIKNQLLLRHAYEHLEDVNFVRYAVLCVSRDQFPHVSGGAIELVDQNGKLGVVYHSTWDENQYGGEYELDEVRYPVSSLLLVRKKDLKAFTLENKFKLPCTQYVAYIKDPERCMTILAE